MDTTTAAIIVIAIFALIAVAAFLRFQQRSKVEIKGPFDTGLTLDASSDPTPGAKIGKAKSHAGSVRTEDKTGRGASVDDAEAWGDISAASTPPESEPDPKAKPPA